MLPMALLQVLGSRIQLQQFQCAGRRTSIEFSDEGSELRVSRFPRATPVPIVLRLKSTLPSWHFQDLVCSPTGRLGSQLGAWSLNLGAEYPSPKKVNLLTYSRII